MDKLFAIKDIEIKDIFLDIKYEGSSFDGVMNIQDLGNELIGLEYCIKAILKNLLKENKKNIDEKLKKELENFDINDIEFITEGFVNNCFFKKIKPKKFLNEIEKRPELNKYILTILKRGMTLFGVIYTTNMTINSDILKLALEKNTIPQEVVQEIQESPLDLTSKNVALSLIGNKKFRESSAKTVLPLKKEDDCLQFSSPNFEKIENQTITINNDNKETFLITGISEEDTEDMDDIEYEKYDKVEGRISSIKLDAIKNQIGFKVGNEGGEIDCHLIEDLDIEDYKNGYLGEWVEIEGLIKYSKDKTKYIEIKKIKKITAPLSEAKQSSMESIFDN
ncbi:MAG: hypothetical protein KAU07_00040 [Candidatus Andersenbacteria bacterium]|nr:hypothetical protein [Candidatus Andersenbacteria bacterium]